MKGSLYFIKKCLREINLKYINRCIRNFLTPIDYARTVEIPTLVDASGILQYMDKPLRILDIGSPQLLSILLASCSNKWSLTYINPFAKELNALYELKIMMNLDNIEIKCGDITGINCSDQLLQEYDYIFSCSVFEHIHPEYGGDVIASANIYNLLKENGVFSLSVPYYKKGFHEYKYGDVYSVRGKPDEKMFFQRFYDQETLHKQIIVPSKLSIIKEEYIGERFYWPKNIHRRFVLVTNGKSRFLLGRLYFKLSRIFTTVQSETKNLTKPWLAILVLSK